MRGDSPRNGAPGAAPAALSGPVSAPASEPVADVFDLLRRRTLAVLDGLAAGGVLPAGLDLGRFTPVPPRPGAPGDAVIHAGLAAWSAGAGGGAPRLADALADGLRAAPEVGAVDVAPGGTLVLTLRPATLLAAVRGVLQSPRARRPPAAEPGRAAASLPRARAEAWAEIGAALAAACASAGGASHVGDRADDAAAASAPVAVRGRLPPGEDVLGWIGRDAFRFAVAGCRGDEVLLLDLDVLGDRTRDDASFWVRYAHARACGLLRGAAAPSPGWALGPFDLTAADGAGTAGGGEVRLARLVARHAHVVAGGSPQKLVAHLRAVAEAVHAQWNTSKQQPQSRFVNEELRDSVEARLGLVTAAALVLRSGLDIIGIAAPDEMP